MTATRRSLLEEVVRAGATYPDVGEPPALMHMGAAREATPEIVAWRATLAVRKKLREAMILRERIKRKEKMSEAAGKAGKG